MSGQRTALVTGCSSGVGLHAAVRLAEAGWRTIATMRDLAKQGPLLEAAKASGVALAVDRLDVADPEAIGPTVERLIARHGGVDLLVNNAGAGFLGSVEQTSDADLRRTMEVNFFGVWNLTKALLPHMRERRSGRVISVTSVGGIVGQPFNEAYCAAKFAVEGMMEGLAPIARQMGVFVSVVEPGPINTEFVNSVRATSDATRAPPPAPYDAILANYMRGSGDMFRTYGQTGDDIAHIIVEVANAETPPFRILTSEFAKMFVQAKLADPTGAKVVDMFAARLAGAKT
jgi:NAD(P)-dependent dehydrogenase (short-subunit alcohol dehydrogenase family)